MVIAQHKHNIKHSHTLTSYIEILITQKFLSLRKEKKNVLYHELFLRLFGGKSLNYFVKKVCLPQKDCIRKELIRFNDILLRNQFYLKRCDGCWL